MKKSEVPLIGKRGLAGALVFAWGAFGFITAHSTANLLVNTPIGPDAAVNAASMVYYDQQAQTLGYKTAEEYLTAKYRGQGEAEMLGGAAFVAWGFFVYGRRKLTGGNTLSPQVTAAAVVSQIKQVGGAIDTKAIAQNALNETRVSNPLVKTLLIWFCRIFGLLGCVASIGMLVNAMSGKASQDDAGVGGSVVMFLVFAGLTACGFWKWKKKAA